MAAKSLFCLAQNEAQVCRILEELKSSGFKDNDISVLLPDQTSSRELTYAKGSKAPEGAVTGVSTGGIVGGVLGWLAGIGALAIPGLGPFVAAGPLMAALSGVAVGGAAGGLIGSLVGLGMPEYEAKRYEARLRQGRILLAVHTENHDQMKRAREIFEACGAEDIASSGEGRVSETSRNAGDLPKAA